MSKQIMNNIKTNKINSDYQCKISSRQINILKLMAEGKTEKSAAISMGVSINTIKYHKKRLYKQLSVSCINSALVKALKLGLLSLDEIKLTT